MKYQKRIRIINQNKSTYIHIQSSRELNTGNLISVSNTRLF